MKNQFTIFIILALFLLSLSSCSVAYIKTINHVIPADVQIPSEIKTIKVMDRSLHPNMLHRLVNDVDNGYIGPNRYGADRKELMKLIVKALPQANQVNFPKEKAGKTDDPADPISKAKIKELEILEHGLLSLDQFQYVESRTYRSFQKHQLDVNGKDYYVDAIKGVRTHRIISFWRLYDVSTGEVILELPRNADHILEVEALNRESVDMKMDTMDVVTSRSLSLELGRSLGLELSPTTIYDNWMYYKKGDKKIELSADLIKDKKYRHAATVLEQSLPRITKSKARERAQYNLAVAYYLHGKREKALAVAKKARKTARKKKEFDRLINKMN